MDENLSTEPIFPDALFRERRKHGKFRVVDAPFLEAPVPDTHEHLQLTATPALNIARCMVWNVDLLCNVIDVAEEGEAAIDQLDGWFAEAPSIAADIAASAMVDAAGLQLPELRLIVGCHPHNAKRFDVDLEARVRAALRDPRACAIGEAGLDFYYDYSPREVQIAAFRRQINMAHELDLPLCLHIRDAHDVALRVLEEEGFPAAGAVLHCYNLDVATLEPWLAHDVYVGFDGPLTFKKNDCVREAACIVPTERLLVETDAPFMTPEPMRGMECGPQHVIFVADLLTRVRGVEGEDARRAFLTQLRENADRLYGRGPRSWQTGRGVLCECEARGMEGGRSAADAPRETDEGAGA